MSKLRQNIRDMYDGESKISSYYDVMMMIVIAVSLIPLIFKKEATILLRIDHITVTLFIIDYILRWFTAGLQFKRGWKSYFLYPVSPWAILDLVCILPSFQVIASGFRILKIARLFRTLRVFRAIKLFRNAKSLRIIIDVISDQWRALMTVLALACAYVLIVALVMFNVEPNTFHNFFHTIYWASISLTTIGYGDVYPQSIIGQAFTIASSFVGVAIIALPSGIIAGGFMEEINKPKEESPDSDEAINEGNFSGTSHTADPFERIEKLSELHKKSILTDEEYNAKKAEMLSEL